MRAALALVPPAERGRVRAAAGWLADDLERWARPADTAVDRALTDRLASVVAAIAPGMPRARLAVLARYSLWTVLLDDQLDAPGADPARVRSHAERVAAIAAPGRPPAPPTGPPAVDFLTAALADLLDRFAAHDADGALTARLGTALCDAVRAATSCAVLSRGISAGTTPPPTVTEYLAVASHDVNYRSFGYGLALLTGAHLSGPALDRLDTALTPACQAVRLANDLRSAGRDRAEGRLNVLSLRDRGGAPVTVAVVRRHLSGLVRRHNRLLHDMAEPGLRPCLAALSNSLRIAVGMYRVADLR